MPFIRDFFCTWYNHKSFPSSFIPIHYLPMPFIIFNPRTCYDTAVLSEGAANGSCPSIGNHKSIHTAVKKRLVYVWPQLASNLNWFGAYQLSFSAVKNKNVDLMYEFICIILLMFPRIFSISTDKPKTHLRLSNWSTRLIGVVASSPLQRTNSKTSLQCSVIR